MDSVKDLNSLLDEEIVALRELMDAWQKAKDAKDWQEADRLRNHMKYWDEYLLLVDGLWHPNNENPLHRQKRAFLRMQRYKISVYPWSIDES